ncbi:MAG: uracil-DNA glycosylase [Bacteroidales bacterium]|nr:uracil-DNA glycosylase [Bacteroidales bacterium]
MAAEGVQIEESWKQLLYDQFDAAYFKELKAFLIEEKKKYIVYPPGQLIFNAFNKTPVDKVKVVIMGQDPYHGQGQAHGLCFSVPKGIQPPPSLVNIFKELQSDLGISPPPHGCLEKWADNGVLLLNATLTVRANQPRSHFNKGWEIFTNTAVERLAKVRKNLVFFLWGNDAKAKESLIDPSRHLVLKAAHPSPFSAYNGFFGCRHFSKANAYLINNGIEPVDWQIT